VSTLSLGTHQAPYSMGNGDSFLAGLDSGQDVKLTSQLHLILRLREWNYKCQYASNASYFCFETKITIIMKFTYIMGFYFTKFTLFFHKVSFIINTICPPLHDTQCAVCIKLFSETSELFIQLCFSSLSSTK
jgi:hypothetical protein